MRRNVRTVLRPPWLRTFQLHPSRLNNISRGRVRRPHRPEPRNGVGRQALLLTSGWFPNSPRPATVAAGLLLRRLWNRLRRLAFSIRNRTLPHLTPTTCPVLWQSHLRGASAPRFSSRPCLARARDGGTDVGPARDAQTKGPRR